MFEVLSSMSLVLFISAYARLQPKYAVQTLTASMKTTSAKAAPMRRASARPSSRQRRAVSASAAVPVKSASIPARVVEFQSPHELKASRKRFAHIGSLRRSQPQSGDE